MNTVKNIYDTIEYLFIQGKIKLQKGTPYGAEVEVHDENGKVFTFITSENGVFRIHLLLNKKYTLVFKKTNHLGKKIAFDTTSPIPQVKHNYTFVVNLFELDENSPVTIAEKPIAHIAYDYRLNKFSHNETYTSKVLDEISQYQKVA